MAKFTEQHLAEEMKQLMLKKNLDHITVKDLTNAADVNRKTFYFHYHGIGDLIVSMYTKRFKQSLGGRIFTPATWQEQYLNLLKAIREESPWIERIYKSSYAPYFRMKMEELIKLAMNEFILETVKVYEKKHHYNLKLAENQIAYITQYYSTAFFGMLEQWFLKGMKEKEEDFIFILRLLNKDNMYRTFEYIDAYNRGLKTRKELSVEDE